MRGDDAAEDGTQDVRDRESDADQGSYGIRTDRPEFDERYLREGVKAGTANALKRTANDTGTRKKSARGISNSFAFSQSARNSQRRDGSRLCAAYGKGGEQDPGGYAQTFASEDVAQLGKSNGEACLPTRCQSRVMRADNKTAVPRGGGVATNSYR